MSQKNFYTDDYVGAPIEDEKEVIELVIKNIGTGETTISHLHADTVQTLISSDPDLETVFLHD